MMDIDEIRCSLCRKKIVPKSRADVPILDMNTGFAICKNCIKELNRYVEEEEAQSKKNTKKKFTDSLDDLLQRNKPHVIKEYLDKFIIKQERAKKILSVAAYNHYKRMKYDIDNAGKDDDIDKSNVIIR